MIRKTKTILIFSIIYLVVSVAAFTLVTNQVNKVGTELEERVKVVANSYAKEVKYKELSELAEETAAQREELKQYILSEEDTILFLAEIEKIGAEQGTTLVTNSLNVVKDQNGNDHLAVSLSISGQEELVTKMLHILETLPYHSEVKDLTMAYGITSEADEEEVTIGTQVKLNMTIDLLLF